ncbi:MAG: RNA polymerase sigma factor [Acidobacteriota bacterium]
MKASGILFPKPDTSWSDAQLVGACLEGSEEAWSVIVGRYKNLIFSIPVKYGLSADAADVFQAVCLDLLSELPRLREPRALPGWLIKVTSHKCFHWKKREARYVNSEPAQSELGRLKEPDPAIDDLLGQVEREQAVRDALTEMPGRCRELIQMLFFEFPPQPYVKVAKRLGIARGSIGFIRRRCLDRLRRSLESKGFE